MFAEIGLAFGLSLVGMIVVGTIVKGILGLRTAINYVVQQLVLGGAAYYALTTLGWSLPAVAVMAAFPLVIHITVRLLNIYINWKAASGGYGEEARWAYELFNEPDHEFIQAQTVLPEMDVREVVVIADSKQELRDLMVERFKNYNEQ